MDGDKIQAVTDEELVASLRDKAGRFDYDGWVDTAVILSQAADAIHRLSHQANDWEKLADHWRKKYEELERQMQEAAER